MQETDWCGNFKDASKRVDKRWVFELVNMRGRKQAAGEGWAGVKACSCLTHIRSEMLAAYE